MDKGKNRIVITLLVLTLFILPFVYGGIFQDLMFHINGTTNTDSVGFNIQGGFDFNNDSIPDLLVSAGTNDRVYVIYGSTTGFGNITSISVRANLTFTGVASSDFGGNTNANIRGATFIPDFNNDSIADLLVTAHSGDTNGLTDNGQAFVFFGASNWNRTVSHLTANVTINGSFTAQGVSQRLSGSRDAGDFNADNISDLLIPVEATTNNTVLVNTGTMYVIYGVNNYPSGTNFILGQNGNVTIMSVQNNTGAGATAVSIGDIDNDGVDDFAMGIQGNAGGGTSRGEVYIFLGLSYTTVTNITTQQANFSFNGTANSDSLGVVGYIGDINNDTIDDFAISASLADPSGGASAGRMYLFFGIQGMADTLKGRNPLTANITINGTRANEMFGSTNNNLIGGDVNGDLINDLIIGDEVADLFNLGNHTRVFYGANGMGNNVHYNNTQANVTFNGSAESVAFGRGVALWDYDNDTLKEVVVGDPAHAGGGTTRGQVRIFELVDNVAPFLNITNPLNITYTNTSSSSGFENYTLNITVHDNIAGTGSKSSLNTCWFTNTTGTNNTFNCLQNTTFIIYNAAGGVSAGITVFVNDSSGNINQSTLSFRIDLTTATSAASTTTSGGGGGGSSGGSGDAASTVSGDQVKDIGRLSVPGSERDMAVNAEVKFLLDGGEQHSAKITSIDKTKGEVELLISSEPQKVIVKVSETVNVDLTGDGFAEISVFLEQITEKGTAILRFAKLNNGPRVIKGEAREEALTADKETSGKTLGERLSETKVGEAIKATPFWLWIIVVLAIVGAGIGYWIYKKRY